MSATPHLEAIQQVGCPLPPCSSHAVSVSLPTWSANIGYEEAQESILSQMRAGYPRFFIHQSILALARDIVNRHSPLDNEALLFPSSESADLCIDYISTKTSPQDRENVRKINYNPACGTSRASFNSSVAARGEISPISLWAVIFPEPLFKFAKEFWQHTGEGISSRRAEVLKVLLDKDLLVMTPLCDPRPQDPSQGEISDPAGSPENDVLRNPQECRFEPDDYGPELPSLSESEDAKKQVKERIAGLLSSSCAPDVLDISNHLDCTGIQDPNIHVSPEDVYLYPCGMNAMWRSHSIIRSILDPSSSCKTIIFNFAYLDTIKVAEKFGGGCLLYAAGSEDDLDDLERRLQAGERVLAIFCEFPSNPLMRSPNLARIRTLADNYDFPVLVDDTIGTFYNVRVLPYCDILVTSLTKSFSGASDVMAGSVVLNKDSPKYPTLKPLWESTYRDHLWCEDAIVLERNSRDFEERSCKMNKNGEALCEVLLRDPRVKNLYYPKFCKTRRFYDLCKTSRGAYGGVFSVVFHTPAASREFFDDLKIAKGPSLGTNFTLCCPYVILAHYAELEWAKSQGLESHLIRISAGIEPMPQLLECFKSALVGIMDGENNPARKLEVGYRNPSAGLSTS